MRNANRVGLISPEGNAAVVATNAADAACASSVEGSEY